jgi:N-methylhydantoinase A
VTDANLVLGRLQADAFLGGAMQLDVQAAEQAVGKIAEALGIDVEAAARGIIRIANEHMAQALRVISVERGVDPREFVLTSFGGAGGLHVCALADALGMRRALVPVHAGVLSALGMLAAPRARQLSRTLTGVLREFDAPFLQTQLEVLAADGRKALLDEGIPETDMESEFSLDLRYQGQSYTLNIPWHGLEGSQSAFHVAHEERYGHRLDTPVELVNLRCNLHGQPPDIVLPEWQTTQGAPVSLRHARMTGVTTPVPVWPRATLGAGQVITGPALVTESVATTWLPARWICRVDRLGNLLLEHGV